MALGAVIDGVQADRRRTVLRDSSLDLPVVHVRDKRKVAPMPSLESGSGGTSQQGGAHPRAGGKPQDRLHRPRQQLGPATYGALRDRASAGVLGRHAFSTSALLR